MSPVSVFNNAEAAELEYVESMHERGNELGHEKEKVSNQKHPSTNRKKKKKCWDMRVLRLKWVLGARCLILGGGCGVTLGCLVVLWGLGGGLGVGAIGCLQLVFGGAGLQSSRVVGLLVLLSGECCFVTFLTMLLLCFSYWMRILLEMKGFGVVKLIFGVVLFGSRFLLATDFLGTKVVLLKFALAGLIGIDLVDMSKLVF
ncbi:hypothetical protein U1Q18_038642 [Sarracenia purpurea var. burkii]